MCGLQNGLLLNPVTFNNAGLIRLKSSGFLERGVLLLLLLLLLVVVCVFTGVCVCVGGGGGEVLLNHSSTKISFSLEISDDKLVLDIAFMGEWQTV